MDFYVLHNVRCTLPYILGSYCSNRSLDSRLGIFISLFLYFLSVQMISVVEIWNYDCFFGNWLTCKTVTSGVYEL